MLTSLNRIFRIHHAIRRVSKRAMHCVIKAWLRVKKTHRMPSIWVASFAATSALLAAVVLYSPPIPAKATHIQRIAISNAVPQAVARALARHAAQIAMLDTAARQLLGRVSVRILTDSRADAIALAAAHGLPHVEIDITDSAAVTATPDRAWRAPEERTLMNKALNNQWLALHGALWAQKTATLAEALRLNQSLAMLVSRPEHKPSTADRVTVSLRLQQLVLRLDVLDEYLVLLNAPEKEPQQTLLQLHYVLRRDPDNPLLRVACSELLLRCGKPTEALETLTFTSQIQASVTGNIRGRIHFVRGQAYLQLSMPSLAEAEFSLALEAAPDQPEWWSARARAHDALNDILGLCADALQACVLGECSELNLAVRLGRCLPQHSLKAVEK